MTAMSRLKVAMFGALVWGMLAVPTASRLHHRGQLYRHIRPNAW